MLKVDVEYKKGVLFLRLIGKLNAETKRELDEVLELVPTIGFKYVLINFEKLYSIDKLGNQLVDRIHLTLNFEVKLLETSDNNTKDYILNDIKQMIEDLNDLDSLHIPNLITTITNTYRNSIRYIEFLGFNNYGPGIQHLYRQESNDISAVPEFLSINTVDMKPDINIILA